MTVLTGWESLGKFSAMQDSMNQVQTPYRILSNSHSEKAGLTAFPCQKKLTVLRYCVNGDLMEGRVDDVRGLNRGRPFDVS
jgi:hypothetical protein